MATALLLNAVALARRLPVGAVAGFVGGLLGVGGGRRVAAGRFVSPCYTGLHRNAAMQFASVTTRCRRLVSVEWSMS